MTDTPLTPGYAIESPDGRLIPGTFTTRRLWYWDRVARTHPKEYRHSMDCDDDEAAKKRFKRRGFRLVKVVRDGRGLRRRES